jgi:protein-S-isoprenylcysteine O-methyltransferase Ste14
MIWRQTKAVLILPCNVLGVIPLLIAYAARNTRFAAQIPSSAETTTWLALLPFLIGAWIGGWAVGLFWKHGNGTPAPWDPPKNLIIRGPYRHVRNPMISGVVFLLIAEALCFRSIPIGAWAAIFFLGNSVYFPMVEEKGLEKRFGADYLRYKANVPRWIPRLCAWRGDSDH